MATGVDWTKRELETAVDAYLAMLNEERAGNPYSKAELNRELRSGPLSARSKGAIEYRMQNISAVLHELCLPWVEGYKPASNVGANVKDRLREILAERGAVDEADLALTADLRELETRSVRLRSKRGKGLVRGRPRGQPKPRATTGESTSYLRDPLVRAWILDVAQGSCEACGEKAPFEGTNNTPYLETHHMHRLADGGPDTIDNAVAVCPNCHRRLHFGNDRSQYAASIYKRISRLSHPT